MSEEISLAIRGHIDLSALAKTLGMNGDFELIPGPLPNLRHFRADITDPIDCSQQRQLRGFFANEPSEHLQPFIGNGDYTYLVLGAYGNALNIMELIAARFGGYISQG